MRKIKASELTERKLEKDKICKSNSQDLSGAPLSNKQMAKINKKLISKPKKYYIRVMNGTKEVIMIESDSKKRLSERSKDYPEHKISRIYERN